MTDRFYVYRPLLELIGKTEGTDKGRGYNETLAYGKFTGGDRNLIAMTLDQIDELQRAMLAHPANGWNSSALGRYQIVRKTLRAIRRRLKLRGTQLFDAEMQDRMACYLLGGRGVDRWLAGKLSTDAFINQLAREWASLPTTSGRGHYGGQHAAVGVSHVRQVLTQVKTRHLNRDRKKSEPAKPDDGLVDAIVHFVLSLLGIRP